jgi:hypothetical protein
VARGDGPELGHSHTTSATARARRQLRPGKPTSDLRQMRTPALSTTAALRCGWVGRFKRRLSLRDSLQAWAADGAGAATLFIPGLLELVLVLT